MTRPPLKSTGLVTALTLAVSLGAMTAAQAGPYVASVTSAPSYGSSSLANLGTSSPAGQVTTSNVSVVTGERASFSTSGSTTPSGEYAGDYSNSNGIAARSPYPSASTTSGGTKEYFNYLVAEPPSSSSSVTLTFSKAQNGFDLLWGSIGAQDTLTFYSGTNKVGTVNGKDVATKGSLTLNVTSPPNKYVSIDSTVPFTSIMATENSTSPAFEFVPGGSLHDAVPEPGSVALLGTALLGLAGILRVRRRA